MAKRKRIEEVAPALMADVNDILDLIGEGRPVRPEELEVAAAAAVGVRRGWLREVADALGEIPPRTPEFLVFKKCLQSVGMLFVQHGIVSAGEMQAMWMTIEEMER
jgi:hypothetical protein